MFIACSTNFRLVPRPGNIGNFNHSYSMVSTGAVVLLCYSVYFTLFQSYCVATTMKTFTSLMLHTGMCTHVHTAHVLYMYIIHQSMRCGIG